MTEKEKRKDDRLKKKYDKSDDMKKNFIKQYGKKKGLEVYYAYIRKEAMSESHYGSAVNKIPKELDKAVALHKSQAERLRKSSEFKNDAGKTANKIPGQLDKAVAMHKKQAQQLRAAGVGEKNCGCGKTPCKTYGKKKMDENVTDEALLIQDWNVDDIKYTEIEAVDIIKPQPLKPSPSNWRVELGEDWQKENRKDKTDGLSKKAVKAYRRENPGSKLQTAVTTKPSKLKKGSKSAKRRLSFCRRMKGMKKKLTSAKTRRDPDSRINKALRRWNC